MITAAAAQSRPNFAVNSHSGHHAEEVLKPVELDADASSNDPYDQYLAFKKQMQNNTNIEYSMLVTVLPQITPRGGPGVVDFVYTPSAVWRAFTDTPIGSGSFSFAYEQNHFLTAADTASQAASFGLNTLPSDWGIGLSLIHI